MTLTHDGLLFGIYPGGVAGDDSGGLAGGPPDDPALVTRALDRLQGRPGRPFLVRAYAGFDDTTRLGEPHATMAPAAAAQYATRGRRLDLVAQYRSPAGDVDGYCDFLRELVEQYGSVTSTLQVTEEPNVTSTPTLDGYYPVVHEAIVRGVRVVKARARELGYADLRVGFNTTPLFGPATSFVTDLTSLGGAAFITDLDYVGLDFFPDVFQPVRASDLAHAVEGLLRHHRDSVLAPSGMGHLPLHITEHGWPTGPGRHPQRQADVVETVVNVIAAQSKQLHLSGYTHFALRDADSAETGLFHQFGLTTDDYSPKPAFDTMTTLVERFSS
ncbi:MULTISPECIES: hypothetical protein [Streptacidiphilus]|uniref:Uncharacterized protein n=1 Tax=Streptacidiphilus cavernicola TaxID=3342716 RepID=A0ABV6UXY1_9ACTN|nr:hypothetical protein [Streptacidiphilus jeojiense]